MHIKKQIILVLFLLTLTLSACTQIGASPLDESILFQDDFSKVKSGWDRWTGDEGSTDYLNGNYRIHVTRSNWDQWATPYLNFQNVTIEVDTTKVSGTDDNNFGIICNYISSDQFYMLLISSDGYYAIQKNTPAGYVILSSDYFLASDLINQGNATNHIKADCAGGRLTLSVNGSLLSEVTDFDYISGDVGLLAGCFDEADTEIVFDNFVVRELQ
ncbi:MAG: hypothetical protein MUO40_08025 [Anaerolineaceae bacterium]|nr:hypothetical protein [Anaerolineaceae bacterium]